VNNDVGGRPLGEKCGSGGLEFLACGRDPRTARGPDNTGGTRTAWTGPTRGKRDRKGQTSCCSVENRQIVKWNWGLNMGERGSCWEFNSTKGWLEKGHLSSSFFEANKRLGYGVTSIKSLSDA